MFDLDVITQLVESPAAKPLLDKFMEEFTKHYQAETSEFGHAARAIVLALCDTTSKLYDGRPLLERKTIAMLAKDLNRKFLRKAE